jgi:hypothetical protein
MIVNLGIIRFGRSQSSNLLGWAGMEYIEGLAVRALNLDMPSGYKPSNLAKGT